jgi:peroxiredoxin Q/BCP
VANKSSFPISRETVVLLFYPHANTSGCTVQACGVRDREADYAAAGARVIGVSPDEVEDVDKFAGKLHDELVLKALGELAVA